MSEDSKDAARLNRIETKITKLGLSMGVDLTRDKERVKIHTGFGVHHQIRVSGDDISLRDLLTAMEASGISAGRLFVKDVYIGDIEFIRRVDHEATTEGSAKA